MRIGTILAIIFAVPALTLGTEAGACLGGVVERNLKSFGLQDNVNLVVRGNGIVEIGNIKLRYNPKDEKWCRVSGDGCDRVHDDTTIVTQNAAVHVGVEGNLWIGDSDEPRKLKVYPVVVEQDKKEIVASVNLRVLDRVKHSPIEGVSVLEVRSNVTVAKRDPETGDITAIGGFTRSLGKPKDPEVPGLPRETFGCGPASPRHADTGDITTTADPSTPQRQRKPGN